MDIRLPKYHSLKDCCDFRETGCYLRTWEISVPTEDSFAWSVVLSHLTSANLRNEDEFKKRIMDLTDHCDNMTDIKKCISSFNPFLNRYSCFFNKNMKSLVRAFKDKCEKAKMEEVAENEDFKQMVASSIIESHIILVSASENDDIEILKTFPATDENRLRITLYYCEYSDGTEKYNFGLKKERGDQLKRAAFNKILKEAHILKKRRNALFSLNQEGQSFVISVLKSDYKSSICFLYKSSYLAFKLVEAGYEMDPRAVDSNGFSALYHALAAGDSNILYILHSYAANCCHQTDKSFRDPDEFILENLIKLGEVIKHEREKFNEFEELNQEDSKVKQNSNQMVRFNDFLIKMCEKILQERNTQECLVSQDVFEAIMRKNVILSILKTYDIFFFFDETKVSTNSFLMHINDYCDYNVYYTNLDYTATLYFFDNIFGLKERLSLDSDKYSELESHFFLSVLSNRYFSNELLKSSFTLSEKSQYQKSFNDYRKTILSSSQKIRDFKAISLVERLSLRHKIKEFIKILSEVNINKDNVLQRLPESEIHEMLSSLPEVKDELEIRRLSYYLETAINQNVEKVKHVLVIERALQVLGEFIVNGIKNPNSLCFIISVCLPEEVSRKCKQLRNVLSHLDEFSFGSKLKVEKNLSMFRSIQSDLKKVYEIFKDIFDMQQLRLIEFLFRRGFQQIAVHIEETKSSATSFESSEELQLTLGRLKHEYDVLCEIKASLCYKNQIFKNQNILRNITSFINEKLKDEKIWLEKSAETAQTILWPLKYVLTLIAKDCKDLKIKEVDELIKESEEILSSDLETIKQKLEEFWKKYKIFINELHEKINNTSTQITISNDIKKFKNFLNGFTYFSDSEREEILSQIPQEVHDSINLSIQMRKTLESDCPLTIEEIKGMPRLFLTNKKLKDLKVSYKCIPEALEIIKSVSNPVAELNEILGEGFTDMGKDALCKLCNRLQCSEEVRRKLFKLDKGQKIVFPQNHLMNILNRIEHIRKILIEECPNIFELWSKAINVKTKQYAKYKITQRYVRDAEVQASVEMLLFDCMLLLGKKSDMKTLWIKASSLFSGINLRNVLGHGNPTLETIGKLLDPDDLPSVLVGEMLILIEDEPVIQTMHELRSKTDSDFGKFHKIMNDDEDLVHAEMRSKILQCERWKRYSKLIPR